jgi:hypothetical protein
VAAGKRLPGAEVDREAECRADGFASRAGPACKEDVAGVSQVCDAAFLCELSDQGHELGIAQDVRPTRLGAAEVAVQLDETELRTRVRIGDPAPALEVGRRVCLAGVARAGFEQRPRIREMPVDGDSADTGPLGDRADRRAHQPALEVELDGSLDDAPARLEVPVGATSEGQSVWLGGIGVEFKVPGELTGGAFSVVEHPLEPGRLIPPHIHRSSRRRGMT